jgi:flagellar hook-associated protein FlgK
VADFNKAIASAVQAGRSANDLMDQRDLLVQELAAKIGVTTRTGADGTTDVLLGTVELVRGRTAARVEVAGGTSLSAVAPAPPATPAPVTVTAGGVPLAVGGAAGGLLSELKDVLPPFHAELAAVGQVLADRVNAQHAAGFDQAGAPGGAFFALDAATGRLSVAVSGPAGVAASAANGTGTGDRGGANAVALAELSNRTGGPNEVYRKLIVGLGVQAQSANRQVDIQSNILAQVDAAREAEAGVNMDEEMSNMLAYQRAYEGAARFVSAIDQALDTLINRTGRVGL